VNTGDVRGQQVGRALDALHVHRDRAGQRARQGGLAGARHVLEQHVAAAQQRYDGQLDDAALADDHLLDVGDQGGDVVHGAFPK